MAHEVSRPVQAAAGREGERVGDESVRGQVGPAEIAAGQAVPGHAELAGRARRHEPEVSIEDVRARVVDGTADGGVPFLPRRDLPAGGDNRVLGRTVMIDDPDGQRRSGESMQLVAAGEQHAQRGAFEAALGEDGFGQRRDEEGERDPFRGQPGEEPRG